MMCVCVRACLREFGGEVCGAPDIRLRATHKFRGEVCGAPDGYPLESGTLHECCGDLRRIRPLLDSSADVLRVSSEVCGKLRNLAKSERQHGKVPNMAQSRFLLARLL